MADNVGMETDAFEMESGDFSGRAFQPGQLPLSAEEESAWDSLVEEGRAMMAPIREERERRHEENRAAMARARGVDPAKAAGWTSRRDGKGSRKNSEEPSYGVKRFVVARAAGIPFAKAAEMGGVSWNDVMRARSRSEDLMDALRAQQARSRELMLAKAQSVVEQSQDEGARPNFAQMQMAGRIMASLDREHFGEDRGGVRDSSDGEQRSISGGGGFVINVIGDAAAVCAKPAAKTGRALVYTDV